MIEEIFVFVYAIIVILFVGLNIRKGSFIVEPTKLLFLVIILSILATMVLYLRGVDLYLAIKSIAKIVAGGIMFAGTLPMILAGIGLFRFGDEFGPNIFYVRNHIVGVIDAVASLVMIFAGLLIFRLDLVAVGFFFFVLIPFCGNALANAYYYSYQRRLRE
ncbi:MAG: monovalent cation/H(+) antiporter subunit G [Candidatus Methanomethyliaceae archaeon]|nr:monovalent cation/H(+) antiporter subunit G [Candidatus Methanomethyliaceae archaeon]MDW7970910.1 monovalent cation/H(+) antiporter subunit G [Nitrososphaerota archaeon]